MDDCIFCKIAEGEIPSRIVYEDEVVVAFMDNSQVTPGHILVIPREHRENIMAYEDELAAEVFSRLPKISRALTHFDSEINGLNIVMNNGEVAYQTVFHSHIHLIPRYTKDDGFAMTFTDNSASHTDEDLDQISEAISKEIEGENK